MPDLVSLNLEYLFLKVYQLLFGGSVTVRELPQYGLTILQQLSWVCIILAIIFLVAFVYTRMQLGRVHERGQHMRHAAEIAANMPQTAKNPRWEGVLALAGSSNPGDWRRAIIEADILLEQMLKEKGFAGANVGEQLKGASPAHFASLDLAWGAHKIRNDIAHEGEQYALGEREVHSTIDQYRRVFEEFQYI